MVQAQPPLLQLTAAGGFLLWLWGYWGPHTLLCPTGASLPLALFSPCPACSGQLCRGARTLLASSWMGHAVAPAPALMPLVPAVPAVRSPARSASLGTGCHCFSLASQHNLGALPPWAGCSTGRIRSANCRCSSSGIHPGCVVLGHSQLGTGALLAKPCSGTGWGVDPGVMH